MKAEKLIQHFNRINGNALNLSTAKELHAQVIKALDHDSHGPNAKPLEQVRAKLASFIKQCTEKNLVGSDHVEFEPIKYHPGLGLRDLIQVGRKSLGKTESKKVESKKLKVVKPEKADEAMLHGLQCIQQDADYQGAPLGAIGDTTYKVITDKILSLIKKDGLIWRKPWNADHQGKESHAHNYVTKTYYRGANFYLNYLLMSDFNSPYFFTFKQVEKLGGKIKSGSKGWPVIYFKWLYKKTGGALVEETEAMSGNKLKPGYERFPALFYYTVFNHEQTEGVKVKSFEKIKLSEKEKIESCESIVEGMPKRPPITNVKGDRAFYRPATDSITMPLIDQFKKEQEYYCTLFHELIHSTGAESRLKRDFSGRFGSSKYAFEELIAELGASFLCGESGIFYYTMDNSAAYIKGWSKKLMDELTADNKFFVKAAAAAEKASEYILDRENADKKKPKVKEEGKKPKQVAAKKLPVTRNRKPVAKKPASKPATINQQPVAAKLGFLSADQTPTQPTGTFTLPGPMAMLGQLQRFKLQIVIPGETHSSKSQLGMQLANAFAALGDNVAWIDWEQGGLQSKDTQQMISRNTDPENKKRIHVNGALPRTLEAVKDLTKHYKVIALDSGTKLKGQKTNEWIDELREEFPEVVWIIMMQQNAQGGTRGGSAAEFDSPVVLKTYRPDHSDFRKNYATVFKNRGNATGFNYFINLKQLEQQQQAA